MAFRKNNQNKDNFYKNKSSISVPDLTPPRVTPSSFTNKPAYTAKNIATPWQDYRSFDAQLNKIDVNITGYAPLFGKENQTSSMFLGNDYGLFTGDFNHVYNESLFSMLSTINRDIKINYWGLNFTRLDAASKADKVADHAFTTWERNMTTLVSMLDQAMYTDLRFNDYGWQQQVDETNGTPEQTKQFSRYNAVITPRSYMLLAYQTQMINILVTMLNFELLTAQLPLLQELFKDKSEFIVHIQNQLKRSVYTSRVKSILTWLKRRFIDTNFFKNYILPTSIVSKETDGLNSPIIYLTQNTTLPIEPIQYVNPYSGQVDPHSQVIPLEIFFDQGLVEHGANGLITEVQGADADGYLNNVRLNAFNINTILDILMSSNDRATFNLRINAWFNTATQVLNSLNGAILDLSNRRWFRDTEAALQKLASQPSGINWQQNVETNAISGMFKYANYELVNELALAAIPAPVWNDNGYSIDLPIFRKSGLPNTLIHEHAQAFYLPSDNRSMSFIQLFDDIRFTTRQNHHLVGRYENAGLRVPVLTIRNVELTFEPSTYRPIYNERPVSLNDYNTQAYLVLQDKVCIARDSMNSPTTWYNSELIAFVNAIFQNRWADYVKLASQNFILPMA